MKNNLTSGSGPRELLRRVAQRQNTVRLGSRAYIFLLVFSVCYGVLLVLSRLLGLIPDGFSPVTLLAVPACAGALALVVRRAPTATETARLIDTRAGTNDLFLTAVLIEKCAGRYKPLVLKEAQEQAPSIEARRVVPYRWVPKAKHGALSLVVLLAGVLFLPQLDPFGKEEQRQRAAQRRQRLKDSRKATAFRLDNLRRETTARHSKEVERAISELKKMFNATKPTQRKANLTRLSQAQKEMGKLWRKASEQKLKDTLRRSDLNQSFGKGELKELTKWKQELQDGRASSMKKKLDELQKLTDKLAKSSDALEREKLREQIRKALQDLSEFSANELKSKPLDSALARALEQLDMSKLEGMSKEALEGLKESLKLTQEELEKLAQAMRDLKSLEEALKALQLAKKLNELEKLDGKG